MLLKTCMNNKDAGQPVQSVPLLLAAEEVYCMYFISSCLTW